MSIPGLTIIGESINDSVPSTRALYESNDMAGVLALARCQDERGAAYIDVNVGSRSPEWMAELVRQIQTVTSKPLSIDTPDPAIAAAGLTAYDPAIAGGASPILNSISLRRLGMFELVKIRPFRPILLISESAEGSCHTTEETVSAAHQMLALAHTAGIANSDCIFDPGIAPLGSDSEGNLVRLIAAMRRLHADATFAGVHFSVGLSNFTVMLPAKQRKSGGAVKGPLESAFLTRAMPLGLDMVIGSVKRTYSLLPDDHPAMQCVDDCLATSGFDSIKRIRKFYTA